MTIRPSVPEIITVNSEALQTTIRDLLPSQNGFGNELQASNVITPIIDLTATAEGSVLRQDLQTAFSFSNITAFNVKNATTNIINATGYYRIFGSCNANNTSTTTFTASFDVTDGLSSKKLVQFATMQDGGNGFANTLFDFIMKLDAGDTLSATSSGNLIELVGSHRQIADIDGNFV